MAEELSEREQELRRPPLPYSLVLRLRDAAVAMDVICLYVDVEQAALQGFYRIAETELVAAQEASLSPRPSPYVLRSQPPHGRRCRHRILPRSRGRD